MAAFDSDAFDTDAFSSDAFDFGDESGQEGAVNASAQNIRQTGAASIMRRAAFIIALLFLLGAF